GTAGESAESTSVSIGVAQRQNHEIDGSHQQGCERHKSAAGCCRGCRRGSGFHFMSAKIFFITGTDTGVGKTYVTAALLAELRKRGVKAAALKPIACGAGGRNDARTFVRLMKNEVPLDVINPVYLRHPLAPSVAAKLEKRKINLAPIFKAYRQLLKKY